MDNKPQKGKNVFADINKFLELVPLDYIFAALCTGFCFSSFITLLATEGTYTDINFVASVSLPSVLAAALVIAAACVATAVFTKCKQIIAAALLVTAVLFGCGLAAKGSYLNEESAKNIFMNIGIGFIMFFVIAWVCKDDKLNINNVKMPKNSEWFVAGAGMLLFTVAVSWASIARYNAYLASNFDFGIFAQMFENMRTTGLPDTTVERNVLMSHFGVHFSPFYYVLLPFYMLCPRPETLLVIQAAFVALGAVPVVLICKKLEFTRSQTVACSVIYLFFPTLANGCLYDFHENKFLTVLIMWAMYFIVSKRWIGTVVFCALVLTVKEDAAIYVMAIALYVLVCRKEYLLGGGILIGAVIYFSVATTVVAELGDGVMTGRLQNYMLQGEDGFSAVIKTCLSDFGYFISQIFTANKIMFMVWMLLPVAFAPFFSEKKSMLLLFIPMLAVDLMSNWQYQYDVKFQYTYGVAALIVFMAIMVISQAKPGAKNKLLLYSVSMCIVMSFSLFVPRSAYYINCEKGNASFASDYNSLIAEIPNDVEISADGSYIPHMYNFKNLYQYPNVHGDNAKTDYLLVSANAVSRNDDNLASFIGTDYHLEKQSGNMCLYKLNK